MLKLTNPHANRAWQAWLTYLSKGKPVAGCYLPNAYVKDFLVMVQNSGILFLLEVGIHFLEFPAEPPPIILVVKGMKVSAEQKRDGEYSY